VVESVILHIQVYYDFIFDHEVLSFDYEFHEFLLRQSLRIDFEFIELFLTTKFFFLTTNYTNLLRSI